MYVSPGGRSSTSKLTDCLPLEWARKLFAMRLLAPPILKEYVFNRSLVAYDVLSYQVSVTEVVWTSRHFQFLSRHLYLTLANFGTRSICTALRLHFTHSPPMAERDKSPQNAQSSSPPHIEPDAASEAPSSDSSSHHGQSWFQRLKDWSPSLVLENTGSVGGVISSTEAGARSKEWI